MTVSVMITTRNRVVDLRRTCRALQQLNPLPLEVLITIDGSTDHMAEAVEAELPRARTFVNPMDLGSVASRDRMMREARGDLVLALDDDSYPEQLDCIARIVPFFEQRPELAVLHFPQRTDEYPQTLQQTDFSPEHLTRSFALAQCCGDPLISGCQDLSRDSSTCMKSRTTHFNAWPRVMTCFSLQLSRFATITPGKRAMRSAFTIVMRGTNSGAL